MSYSYIERPYEITPGIRKTEEKEGEIWCFIQTGFDCKSYFAYLCSYSIGSISTGAVREQEDFRDFLMEKGASIALMTNSWNARDAVQLTAFKNEHVEILDDTRNWWSVRNMRGQVGYIPCTFVRKIIYETVRLLRDFVY